MEWQDIATAPKDGTVIDLWMVDMEGKGWREVDAYFVEGYPCEDRIFDASLGYYYYRNMGSKRDGWFAPNHDYDFQDGWCDEPEWFNAHPRQMKTFFTKPTHWMPRPAPPAPTKGTHHDRI